MGQNLVRIIATRASTAIAVQTPTESQNGLSASPGENVVVVGGLGVVGEGVSGGGPKAGPNLTMAPRTRALKSLKLRDKDSVLKFIIIAELNAIVYLKVTSKFEVFRDRCVDMDVMDVAV